MLIQLPEKFQYYDSKIRAYVEDGVLYINNPSYYNQIMYALTYELKGEEVCHYCGKKLTSSNRTLDHLYPKDLGGISVPNNMEPCCSKCNEDKSNLLEEQYKSLQKIKDVSRRKILRDKMNEENCELRKKNGVIIPKKWYIMKAEATVYAPVSLGKPMKTSRNYQRLLLKYEVYGKLCKPIVISKNRFVLDGFSAVILAKNLEIKEPLPIVMLENVIVV